MEFNLLTLVGISLAAMFFGYFFGLFEGRGQGYKNRKRDEALEKPAIPSPPALKSPRDGPSGASARENSLLQLALDENQRPRLELDGQRVDAGALPPAQRQRLIDLMLVMRPWVEPGTAAKPAVPEPRVAPASPPTMAERFRAAARSSDSGVGLNPAVAPVAAVAGTSEAIPAVAPISLVGQIDAILQAHIAGTALSKQAVRLAESDQGGVTIVVGTQRYATVGDVPDPAVQAAIKAAIAEWEEKYTPG